MNSVNKYPIFISSEGLKWRGVLKGISKASDPLQPLYEAFTNSLEAIELRKQVDNDFKPFIFIDFFFNVDTEGKNDGLSKLVISDNGIGFDDANFERFRIFKDDSKGFNNRGSGRIQLLHSFSLCHYESRFKDNNLIKKRVFNISSSEAYLSHNSILQLFEYGNSETNDIRTTLSLIGLKEKGDIKFFNDKNIENIKEALINHYMVQFCAYDDNLPNININFIQLNTTIASVSITLEDIPHQTVADETIEVPICTISNDMKRIETSDSTVSLTLKSFKLPSSKVKKNSVRLTCKNEVIDSVKVRMECLPVDMEIDNCRYLFLLSGEYIDNHIGDTRDSFEILNRTDFKKKAKQYGAITPQIILDDIEKKVSEKAVELFSEISVQEEIHQERLQSLKKTYMLSEEALETADINDTVEEILLKAYTYDAKLIAKQDATYQEKVLELEQLDTTSGTYQEDLENIVEELAKTIPLQCKETLSRYVTHRTLVLELFNKLIKRSTEVQRNAERKYDEKLIHNLILSQHNENSKNSDIWMLNEDYLYYKGVSEEMLKDIVITGKKLFREEITQAEENYIKSLGENRFTKRPDILLFPSEHKCIIIEFKSLEANLSNHLGQINKYASFIRSYTTEDFYIDTFYGYLIGEALEPNDIRAADNDFKFDPKFNYCYRPSKSIACLGDPSGNHDGVIYTEAISFSVLLERAISRNEAFKSRLFCKY